MQLWEVTYIAISISKCLMFAVSNGELSSESKLCENEELSHITKYSSLEPDSKNDQASCNNPPERVSIVEKQNAEEFGRSVLEKDPKTIPAEGKKIEKFRSTKSELNSQN